MSGRLAPGPEPKPLPLRVARMRSVFVLRLRAPHARLRVAPGARFAHGTGLGQSALRVAAPVLQ